MIPKQCKRLAEVDFPIAVVSRHSAREKSIRHGHPSTLHLWWARRPLAACRAMLMALLLPDPEDAACPGEFKDAARKALLALPGAPSKWSKDLKSDEGLRQGLLKFIGDFANWDVASNSACLKASRALVKAAHGDEPPLVVDPFAGGGSIPLEALRIGCDAFASDLNPVACLILKTAYKEFEERLGRIEAPRGEKTELVLRAIRQAGRTFRVADVQQACPGVSLDLIRVTLKHLQAAGRVACLGRGRLARWKKAARWRIG